MTGQVIPFAVARPAALARLAKRDRFADLKVGRRALTIDAEPDGTFGVRVWPHRTPRDAAFFHVFATATEARTRAQNAVLNSPGVFQFVVDRSEVEASGGAA